MDRIFLSFFFLLFIVDNGVDSALPDVLCDSIIKFWNIKHYNSEHLIEFIASSFNYFFFK